MAYIANVSGDSSGAMVTDDLDIAEELSAISTPEEDHHHILEQLKNYELRLQLKLYFLKRLVGGRSDRILSIETFDKRLNALIGY